MKRLLSILLCCILLAGCASQSGSPSEAGPEPHLQFVTSGAPLAASDKSPPEADHDSAIPAIQPMATVSREEPPPDSGPEALSGLGTASSQPDFQRPEDSHSEDPLIERLTQQVYDGAAAGPRASAFIYPVTVDWASIVTNYSYDTPGQAHLSWKVTSTLEGFLYAYRATGDQQFLEQSVALYEALIQKRDDQLGRPAWNGMCYPLWGSTARYNGASFSLLDSSGNCIAQLWFYCQGNDETEVSISHNADGSFNLSIRHQGTAYQLNRLTLQTLPQRVASEIGWTYYGSPLNTKKSCLCNALYRSKPVAAGP